MCKSYVDGYKRCDASAESKARESVRKSINYYAGKSGMTVNEWKEANPDKLKIINGTYESKLKQFENKKNHCDNSILATSPPVGAVGVTTFQKILNHLQNGKNNNGFALAGERRRDNSPVPDDSYKELSRDYLQEFNLTKDEKKAISLYTGDFYSPINRYLIEGALKKENAPSWKDANTIGMAKFKDESDIVDCISKIDSVLSHRNSKERIIYRGIRVYPNSKILLEANEGENVYAPGERKKIMSQTYGKGSELVFDSFSSASDRVSVAADWGGAHTRGISYETIYESTVGVIFEIRTSAGVPIAHLSQHSPEREILLPRGLKFRIANSYWNSTDKKDCYKYKNSRNSNADSKNPNILIVQLVEIDDAGNEITDHTSDYVAPSLVEGKRNV